MYCCVLFNNAIKLDQIFLHFFFLSESNQNGVLFTIIAIYYETVAEQKLGKPRRLTRVSVCN